MTIVFDKVKKLRGLRELTLNWKYFAFALPVMLLLNCNSSKQELSADQIVSKAIESHGGSLYDNMIVEFDFRNRHFKAQVKNGQYVYERSFESDEGWVTDVYENKKFKRMVGEKEVELTGEVSRTYQNATNSVIYFALLPFHLDDPVINRQLMRSVEIKGQPYHKVEVTFGDGGGDNFENSYVYWIHKNNFTIDYFAYSFNVNGGGVRFREVSNVQVVEGIRFQDYNNYTIDKDYPAHELDYAFKMGDLELVSTIELENILVELNVD